MATIKPCIKPPTLLGMQPPLHRVVLKVTH